MTIEDRFWIKVDIQGPDDCWEWRAGLDSSGYGQFWHSPERAGLTAHRFAYELIFEEVPSSVCVCHTCDNPKCCNPAHLFPGSNLINMQDRSAKGRTARMYGETNACSKLTATQVQGIRDQVSLGVQQKDVALSYGVSRALICLIVNNKIWRG